METWLNRFLFSWSEAFVLRYDQRVFRFTFSSLVVLLLAGGARAGEHWREFRGPGGQGHAEARGLPLRWSETENVTWKVPIPGEGWSSPVIEGDQIWMTTATNKGASLRAVCVDRVSGRLLHDVEVFRQENPAAVNAKNSYASPTPVIEPGRLYVHYGTFGTACLDTNTGAVLWSTRKLRLDHKEGPGSSPILYDNLFIVHCDGMDVQYVVALDKNTGRIVWKTKRSGKLHENIDFRKAFCTPLLIRINGEDQLVSVGAFHVYGYDPKTGRELWVVDFDGFSNVPRPVFGHGMIFIVTGFTRPQLWAIRPMGRGNLTASQVIWRVKKQVPTIPSPLLVDGELYMVSNKGIATCLDARTGKECWRERLGGNYSASPVCAEDRIYFFSEEGKTTVLSPGRRFTVLATNELDTMLLASPAIAGRAIYLRGKSHLYRIEDKRAALANE